MKKGLILIICLCLSVPILAQQVVSGKSKPTLIDIKPKYEKSTLPPNLYAKLSFKDENNNGILEALENAKITITLTNKGKGPAQNLKVSVKDNIQYSGISIGDGQNIPFLYPGKSVTISVAMSAGIEIKTGEHKFEINVKEHFGYDMDPAYLMISTFQFEEPLLAFSGLEIHDAGEGTVALIEDKLIQPGELVKVKLYIQNIGQNISKDTKYSIKTIDENIMLQDAEGVFGNVGIGQVKEAWFSISPNKRVIPTGKLPIYLNVSNAFRKGEINNFQLPLELNKRSAEPNIIKVEANIERLHSQVARFEYKSDRITSGIADIIDIRQVPPSLTKRSNAIGIIIGVEKYESYPSAPYAANDALVVKDYFKNKLGISTVLDFTNGQVNGNFFENKFNPVFGDLQRAVIKGQTEVFIYYSGHGIPSKDGEKVFLLPYDGRIEAIEKQGYELNALFQNLEALKAKSVTVFLDACFSGISRPTETAEANNLVASKGARIKPKIVEPWLSDPNFQVFSSSDYDETALGYDGSETGLFTYYLCVGLQGKADINFDRNITAGELSDYIIANVKETSVKIRGLQTPQFYGNRTMVLVTY